MRRFYVFGTLILAISFSACVKKSVYRTEQLARSQAESREKILISELSDRKREADKMVDMIGALNRTAGRLESDLAALRQRMAQQSENANKTSAQWEEERQALEQQLKQQQDSLFFTKSELNRLDNLLKTRDKAAADLLDEVTTVFQGFAGTEGYVKSGTVVLILPDPLLFDATGVNLNKDGKVVLELLATLLNKHPSVVTEVVAHTDNQLPKNSRSLGDTWEWSLRRAMLIVKTLTTEWGVTANQLQPSGRGEYVPVAANDTPEGRSKNRRTEIILRPYFPEIR